MQCWLAGAFALDDDGGDVLDRSMVVHLEGAPSSLRRAIRERAAEIRVTGEIAAEHLGEGLPVSGRVSLTRRGARYELHFTDDRGRELALAGEQELALRRPPRGFSVITGELLQGDRRIGRVRLRLDPRNGMKGLLSWA